MREDDTRRGSGEAGPPVGDDAPGRDDGAGGPRFADPERDRGRDRAGDREEDRRKREDGPRRDPDDPGSGRCELCGGPTVERHCKIVCTRCGYQRDCSDP